MHTIKVAHVTTIDAAFRALLINQLRSMREEGYEITGISAPGRDVALLEREGVRHVAVPMTRNFTPFADLLSLWRLYRVMRHERFTIVHTHTPKAGLLGQLAARLAGVPIVINTVHGFYFHDHMSHAWRRFYILMEKLAARCSDVILSQNREDLQTAIEEGICAPGKIKHLGNGIDLAQFDPDRVSPSEERQLRRKLGIADNTPVVGFVGRLAARRKGFLDFMDAARGVAARLPQVRFLIVGETDHGKPDAVTPDVAERYGIADRCLFVGQRDNQELPSFYKLMNVLVLPSIFEGLPRVVMEASAMGVPSVVSNVKGNREAVREGCNGLLVPFGDVPSLRSAILRILREPDTARAMSSQARRIAAECFDEQAVFETVKAEYARLLEQTGLGRTSA